MTRRTLAILALATLAGGCGPRGGLSSPDPGGPDGRAIAELIGDLDEQKYDQAMLRRLFAGPLPSDWKRFDRYGIELDGPPAVSGTTATGRVRLRPDAGEAVTADWTFEKVGDKWKLKAAPLPGPAK